MDRANTTADVEHRVPLDATSRKAIDQRARHARRPILTVGAQLFGCVASIELAIEWRVG